ncbi:hypothetical protein ACWD0G_28895, partial [Streptomyces goshikiensis]
HPNRTVPGTPPTVRSGGRPAVYATREDNPPSSVAHGVTTGIYAHVLLHLQRQAIDARDNALSLTDEGPDDLPTT